MRVKICGIRNEQDLDIVVRSGADAAGFLCGLTHLSEDELSPEDTRTLISSAPPFLSTVLVSHFVDPRSLVDLLQFVGAHILQIHSDMGSQEVAEVRAALPQQKIIKAIHILPGSSPEQVVELASAFEPFVNAILLDSRTEDRLGGTGLTHDWSVSQHITQAITCPVILAGGLNVQNICPAIKRVSPFAVDVNSGVEDMSGNKDINACTQFVRLAKSNQHHYPI